VNRGLDARLAGLARKVVDSLPRLLTEKESAKATVVQ
jgi:hypothetical protein